MTQMERYPASHLLDGLVKCRNCGIPMKSNEVRRYVCPAPRGTCDTPAFSVITFNRLMVATMLNAILSGENNRKVIDIVQQRALEEIAQWELDTADGPIQPPEVVDAEPRTPLQSSQAEYLEKQRRAAPYWNMMTNTAQVAEYSRNLDTYLRPSNIRTTRAIMEYAVEEILAGRDSVTIKYRMPMPPGGGSKARTFEEVTT